jgi:multisubunit Na+/H+ antiporter MnhG subunit
MIEPVALENFFLTFFSAATVILTGGLYALLFAYARVRNRPRLMPLAYAAYLGLFVSVLALAHATNMLNHAFWIVIVLLMLVGYLFAPHAIWHLCVGTHQEEATREEAETVNAYSTAVQSREA